MTRGSATFEFSAFHNEVVADVALRDVLLAAATPDALDQTILLEAAQRGRHFSLQEVIGQRNRLRRDWMEQWLPRRASDQPPSIDTACDRPVDFAGWMPIRLFHQDGELAVDWCYTGTQRLTRPFFNEDAAHWLSKPFNQVFRRYTPIDAMVSWSEQIQRSGRAISLRAIIGHVSRCGSTLICQMLGELPTHRVVSEPPMLDVLLNVRRNCPSVSTAQQTRWIRALVDALGHSSGAETELLIKLDAWHLLDIEVIREAFPTTPLVLVIRDPAAVAASHLKLPALYMIPGAISQMPWRPPLDSPAWLDDGFYIASTLGEIYRCAERVCSRSDCATIVVDHAQLPGIVNTGLGAVLGIPHNGAAAAAVSKRAANSAKRPNQEFDSTADRERTLALPPQIRDAVYAECGEPYRKLRARAGGGDCSLPRCL